jgi:hypothetical protein
MFELLLLFAFSVIVAIVFNWGTPKFAATGFGKKFVGSYLRVTLGTALVFFLAIYVAAIGLSLFSGSLRLPTRSAPVP